ncbi:Peptidyl-tRNA hydrolase [Paraliobacillus sp. PM-2]|uniref:aminoacyl-tRNA hydrolase n=1 Tax=Paraliobacillus sp. PM-2 TaxID=1462524 RepID=UPI00061BF0AA|nr:aminoacyl-tRNA hydrolase [Paraliobacillus sp. PM-2]CQR47482.1 Peptidyl-tRNA hydrolase [Paraliobacillus sp. PM-2]
MKCIVGLGNPGKKYEDTRHNIGFMVLDELATYNNWKINKSKFNGLYTMEKMEQTKIILLKPQTYMNLSGDSIRPLMDFYKLEVSDILVVYDDLDLPTGKIRLRQKGGHGGHNGIRSIIDHLGTKNFNRLRIGIDRPSGHASVIDHVLGDFDKSQHLEVQEGIKHAVQACNAWMHKPFQEVMNDFNQ